MNNNQIRNYGIDQLRLLSMFYIVLMHALLQGGILYHAVPGSVTYTIAWLMEVICYVSVDCFGLISGYVGYSEKVKVPHFSRWFSLWLEVMFYNLFIAVAMNIRSGVPDAAYYKYALLPVTSNTYWYFTAYTVLFICIPFLNAGVKQLNDRQLAALNYCMFVFFSIIETLCPVFRLENGYSFLWLAILYVFGASLKRLQNKLPGNKKCRIGIILCTVGLWLIIMAAGIGSSKEPTVSNKLLSYISPLVLIPSVCYVLLFSRKASPKKTGLLISKYAANAFAIYLINTQPYFFNHILSGAFQPLIDHSALFMVAVLLLFTCLFCIACLIIDRARALLFHAVHLDQFSKALEKLVNRAFYSLLQVF